MRNWPGIVVVSLVLSGSAALARADITEPDVDARIAQLILQLGDSEYVNRERAQRELAGLGFAAFDALSEAENHEDIEIASRAKYLASLVRVDWTREDDPPQIREILKNYELQSPQDRKLKMAQLAELPDELGLARLCRIVRFEQLQKLSKEAALVIMKQKRQLDEVGWEKRSKVIVDSLGGSTRPAAKWLKAYVEGRTSSQDALEQWIKLTAAEQQTLRKNSEQSDPRFITELLRRQVEVLERLGRSDAALAVMRQMVDTIKADSTSVAEMVQWLVDHKAWAMLDVVAERFAKSFDSDPGLLYTLAHARLKQGNQKLADETAERALRISTQPLVHLQIADVLQKRGLIKWSDGEFRAVIDASPVHAPESMKARILLSESLHDRQLDEAAGSVLKPLVDVMDRGGDAGRMAERWLQRDRSQSAANSLRSRMYFFFACHHAQAGHREEQLQVLEKAIGYDPGDIDVLIGLYGLSAEGKPERSRVVELITKAVEQCRSAIEELPEDPDPYNQLAWLVANTQGDLDEATQFSHKSIDLMRDNELHHRSGGYYDTLGRCYYAKGDLANALKYQAEAAKLEPHSQQIARQLELFKKVSAEKAAGEKPTGEKPAAEKAVGEKAVSEKPAAAK